MLTALKTAPILKNAKDDRRMHLLKKSAPGGGIFGVEFLEKTNHEILGPERDV